MKKLLLISTLFAAGTLGAWAETYTITTTTALGSIALAGDPGTTYKSSIIQTYWGSTTYGTTITLSDNSTTTKITTTAADTIIIDSDISGFLGSWGSTDLSTPTYGNFVLNKELNITSGAGNNVMAFTGSWSGSGNLTFSTINTAGTGQTYAFLGDMSAYSGDIIRMTTGGTTSFTAAFTDGTGIIQFGSTASGISVTVPTGNYTDKDGNDTGTPKSVSGTGNITTAGLVRYDYAAQADDAVLTVGNGTITAKLLDFTGGATYNVTANLTGTGTGSTLRANAGTTTLAGAVSGFETISVIASATLNLAGTATADSLTNAGTLNIAGTLALSNAITNTGTITIDTTKAVFVLVDGLLTDTGTLSSDASVETRTYTVVDTSSGTLDSSVWESLERKNFQYEDGTLSGRKEFDVSVAGKITIWGSVATLTWNGGDSGTWETSTTAGTTWLKDGTTNDSFYNGDNVIFATAATSGDAVEITLGGAIEAKNVTVSEATKITNVEGNDYSLTMHSLTMSADTDLSGVSNVAIHNISGSGTLTLDKDSSVSVSELSVTVNETLTLAAGTFNVETLASSGTLSISKDAIVDLGQVTFTSNTFTASNLSGAGTVKIGLTNTGWADKVVLTGFTGTAEFYSATAAYAKGIMLGASTLADGVTLKFNDTTGFANGTTLTDGKKVNLIFAGSANTFQTNQNNGLKIMGTTTVEKGAVASHSNGSIELAGAVTINGTLEKGSTSGNYTLTISGDITGTGTLANAYGGLAIKGAVNLGTLQVSSTASAGTVINPTTAAASVAITNVEVGKNAILTVQNGSTKEQAASGYGVNKTFTNVSLASGSKITLTEYRYGNSTTTDYSSTFATTIGSLALSGDATLAVGSLYGAAWKVNGLSLATGTKSATLTLTTAHTANNFALFDFAGSATTGTFSGTISVNQTDTDSCRHTAVQISNDNILKNAVIDYAVSSGTDKTIQDTGAVYKTKLALAINTSNAAVAGLKSEINNPIYVFSGSIAQGPSNEASDMFIYADSAKTLTINFDKKTVDDGNGNTTTTDPNYSFAGDFLGVNIVKDGTGTQTLSGTIADCTYSKEDSGTTTDVTLKSSIAVNNGKLVLSGANTSTGTITIASTGTLESNTASADSDGYTYANAISGTGNFVKSGAGTLNLESANLSGFTGTVTVSAGELKLSGSTSATTVLGERSTVSVAQGAKLTLGTGYSYTTVTGAGEVSVTGTYTYGISSNDGGAKAFYNELAATTVTVEENATLQFRNWNANYKFTVDNLYVYGTLKDEGKESTAKTTSVSVGAGQTIGGSGTIALATTISGTATIDITDGTHLTFTNGVTFATGSKVSVVDQLSAQSNENAAIAVICANAIKFGDTTYTADSYSEDITSVASKYFSASMAGYLWSLSAADGVLTLSYAIPEPSMFGLLAGTLALALAGTRRRNKKS